MKCIRISDLVTVWPEQCEKSELGIVINVLNIKPLIIIVRTPNGEYSLKREDVFVGKEKPVRQESNYQRMASLISSQIVADIDTQIIDDLIKQTEALTRK